MNTKQRKIILAELQALRTHPTADEVFARVRKTMPKISLGTVYRNLNKLADAGIILKLAQPGEQQHFDAFTDDHSHFFCNKCHKIYDLHLPEMMYNVSQAVKTNKQHKISTFKLQFYGVCKQCKQKENNND